MKKIVVSMVAVLALIAGLLAVAGISPAYIYRAPGVATGIGSKLLCSSYFVSGFTLEQSIDDLVQYSPLLEMLDIDIDENQRVVETSFLGLSTKTATMLEGLGCSVDYADYPQRSEITTKVVQASSAQWPKGSTVETIDQELQRLVESQVSLDNELGLNTRAIVAVKSGVIVAEAYGQGADATTPLLGWSMAKSLTSVMLGNLEMRKLLDLGALPSFTDWSVDKRSSISIENLLYLFLIKKKKSTRKTIAPETMQLPCCLPAHLLPISHLLNPWPMSRAPILTTVRELQMCLRGSTQRHWVGPKLLMTTIWIRLLGL